MSGRVNSNKEMYKTCIWVWHMREGWPRFQWEKEATHRFLRTLPSEGALEGVLTRISWQLLLICWSYTIFKFHLRSHPLSWCSYRTQIDLSLLCILQHQSFWHLSMCCITLYMSFVFNVLPTRWEDPFPSVYKHQHVSGVCLELYEAGKHEAKEMAKASWLRLCKLSTQYPFSPFSRARAPLKHSISHLWWPCDRVLAHEIGVEKTGQDSQKVFRLSMCLPYALCPLPLFSTTQTRCQRWRGHCVTLRRWTWGQKPMVQVAEWAAHLQSSCSADTCKEKKTRI